jgi:hypothetical protein
VTRTSWRSDSPPSRSRRSRGRRQRRAARDGRAELPRDPRPCGGGGGAGRPAAAPGAMLSRTRFGSLDSTRAWAARRNDLASVCPSARGSWTLTQPNRAAYGAGIIPARAVRASKSSSEHGNPSGTPRSTLNEANILPPTEKTRWSSHLMSSVLPGSDRQNSCKVFVFTPAVYRTRPPPGANVAAHEGRSSLAASRAAGPREPGAARNVLLRDTNRLSRISQRGVT